MAKRKPKAKSRRDLPSTVYVARDEEGYLMAYEESDLDLLADGDVVGVCTLQAVKKMRVVRSLGD